MLLGQRSAILWNLSMNILMDSPFFCLAARKVGTEISVSSSKKQARNNFSRSAHVLIEPARSFMSHSKVTPLRVPTNKWTMIESFDTTFPVGFEVVYVLVRWPFTVKSMKDRCLELERVGSCPTPLGRVRLSPHLRDRLGLRGPRGVAPICSSSRNNYSRSLSYPSLQMKIRRLRIEMLFTLSICRRWAIPFLPFAFRLLRESLTIWFLFVLSSSDSICLRVSIDSCWARIISNCSFGLGHALRIA